MNTDAYTAFLKSKVRLAKPTGFPVTAGDVNPALKAHQVLAAQWLVEGGTRALFASFGLGKTPIQLETIRLILERVGGRGLIVCPLGVRQEFVRDAVKVLRWSEPPKFIRRIEEAGETGIYLANYETIRDGKLDPRHFIAASLDEASILRGSGGTKTFREFMRLFTGEDGPKCDAQTKREGSVVPYRFVATATPSPNDYIELLVYADFLGVMDISQAKTRFFKRDSTKADVLTLHPHKEREFWLWVASWALFVSKPSDVTNYLPDDVDYTLPPLTVHWHEVPTDHSTAGEDRDGQRKMFRDAALGVQDAASEKRRSIPARIAKLATLLKKSPPKAVPRYRAGDIVPGAQDWDNQAVVWCDLNDEQRAIEQALEADGFTYSSLTGTADVETRETMLEAWRERETGVFLSKPMMYGAGINLQQSSRMIFAGIGFKFYEVIQGVHRIYRFLQTQPCEVHFIYTEAEREVRRKLETKWRQHNTMITKMTDIMREFGLSQAAMASSLTRKLGVERVEIRGERYRLVNNDCVLETQRMLANSVGLVLTSIPFSSQYEYSPNYADFGHSEGNAEFFAQMDFLIPQLLRVLMPGRIAAIHVKDRIVPGGMTGLGFQTVYPFHCRTIEHFTKHGFAFIGMKTITTDVVRENNQTYRLGHTEQCKDGSKMGYGLPEYLLIFRKPQSDSSKGYADVPVEKSKEAFSLGRWQIAAAGDGRSSGNRVLTPDDLDGLSHAQMYQIWREHATTQVHDLEAHVALLDALLAHGKLPVTFSLMPPHSWHSDVWSDITRMLTLNGAQSAAGKEGHLCLARGSLVLTKAGFREIQDLQAGDLVLTHRGRWRPVLRVKNTGVRPVVELQAQGARISLTPDHNVWTRKVGQTAWQVAHSRKAARRAEPAWVEAANTVGSYVNLKLPEEEPASVTDLTYWWVVGRWIACGHIDKRGTAIISCGKDKLDHFLSMAGPFAGRPREARTAFCISLKDKGGKLRRTLRLCGKRAENKHLPPEAYTLPRTLAAALLMGYLAGDGSFNSERGRWSASSASRELLLGVAMLAQRVYGAVAGIHAGHAPGDTMIEGRLVHALQEWCLSFDMPHSGRKKGLPFLLEDGAWKKVRAAERAGEVETWCIKVEEDESFTAEGCIVKNCPMQFDLADRVIEQMSNPGDSVLDPFGGLMTVPYRAMLQGRFGIGFELSPAYFADGACYCKAAEDELAVPSLFDLLTVDEPEHAEAAV